MVAYKKLTNSERSQVAYLMAKNRCKKEIYPIVDTISKEINRKFMEHVPNEVIEFAKKYPKTFSPHRQDIYGWYFLTEEQKNKCRTFQIQWPYFTIDTYYPGCLDFTNDFSNYAQDANFVKWIKKDMPELYNSILVVLDKTEEIYKFKNSLKCALHNINTVNRMKDEFPEAYDIYIDYYGEPAKPCKNDKKQPICDTIEKLRAEYNKD